MSVSSPQPTTFTTLTIPTAMMADATAPNLTTPFANMPTPIVIVDAAGELHDPKIVTVGGITGTTPSQPPTRLSSSSIAIIVTFTIIGFIFFLLVVMNCIDSCHLTGNVLRIRELGERRDREVEERAREARERELQDLDKGTTGEVREDGENGDGRGGVREIKFGVVGEEKGWFEAKKCCDRDEGHVCKDGKEKGKGLREQRILKLFD